MRLGSVEGAPDFDSLARAYRWMEWASFGPLLGLCRSAFLPRLAHCRCALVLGDGDGRFTARLLRENSIIRVHAVDASSLMLAALRRRAGQDADRLTTACADIRVWEAATHAQFDLIVTHFVLDCFTTQEVREIAMRVETAVTPGALWVVSEFAVPSGLFGRLVARPIVHGLYFAFGILTGLDLRDLPDYAAALRDGGFKRIENRSRLGGLLVSELWTTADTFQAQHPG